MGRDLVARLTDGLGGVEAREDEHAGDEEYDQREDGDAIAAGELQAESKQQRPQPTRAAFADLVQADVFGLLACLLYTSDAADERSSVYLGGRRTIKKKKKKRRDGGRRR